MALAVHTIYNDCIPSVDKVRTYWGYTMREFHAGTFDIAVIGAGHAGIEAALAAARRRLTPRYEHCIYSFRYGSELAGLIGRDGEYARAAAPALVEEALLRDPRFQAVRDVTAHRDGDALTVEFTAEADWGVISGQAAVAG